jgi:hypothetical protein
MTDRKEYYKKYNKNRKNRKEYFKEYFKLHPRIEYQREYRKTEAYKNSIKKYRSTEKAKQIQRKNNLINSPKRKSEEFRKKDRIYIANRLKTNVQFKLSNRLRQRINFALRKCYKSGSAVRDLGCSIPELKIWLENKFQPGMDWDNWSLFGWHIDHKIPLKNFDLTNREQFLQAVHYTNLQPMWAEENLKKGAKY